MRTRPVAALLVALLVPLVATGLSGCQREIDGPVLVLRLATPDQEQDPTGQQVQHFADEVSARSRGSIRIEPVWDVTDNSVPGWDQVVAQGVADGEWDLGLVAGRAFDELGVDSLRALSTPFLVTNEPALEAVLDSDVRDELLSGLPDMGLTGVDLFPQGLRHPFGYDAPLLGPEDYDGQFVWSARSDTTTRVLAALGAETSDGNAKDGAPERGAEGSYWQARGQVATGNVTLFPKTEVLVLRTEVRDRLRGDQWALLREAAASTRAWLSSHASTDAEDALAFCEHGGAIVAASPNQTAELTRAVEPVVRWLREDDATRRTIDRIHDLVDDVDGPPPTTSCPAPTPLSSPDPELASLDGTYVSVVTPRQLRDAGVDAHLTAENSGRWSWVLNGGAYSWAMTADHFVKTPTGSGRYTYRDGVLTIYWDDDDVITARPRVRRNGTIEFRDVHESIPAYEQLTAGQFASPWIRVGAAPG